MLPWSDDRMGWKEMAQLIGEKARARDWDANDRSMTEPWLDVPFRVGVRGVLSKLRWCKARKSRKGCSPRDGENGGMLHV